MRNVRKKSEEQGKERKECTKLKDHLVIRVLGNEKAEKRTDGGCHGGAQGEISNAFTFPMMRNHVHDRRLHGRRSTPESSSVKKTDQQQQNQMISKKIAQGGNQVKNNPPKSRRLRPITSMYFPANNRETNAPMTKSPQPVRPSFRRHDTVSRHKRPWWSSISKKLGTRKNWTKIKKEIFRPQLVIFHIKPSLLYHVMKKKPAPIGDFFLKQNKMRPPQQSQRVSWSTGRIGTPGTRVKIRPWTAITRLKYFDTLNIPYHRIFFNNHRFFFRRSAYRLLIK